MAGYGENTSSVDHLERQGPFSNYCLSNATVNELPAPRLMDREACLMVSVDAMSADPLSTLESLPSEEDVVLDSDDRAVSIGDHRGSPGSGLYSGALTGKDESSVSIGNADPLSSLDQLEEIDIACHDSLNRMESFSEGFEPCQSQPTANTPLSANPALSAPCGYLPRDENGNQPDSSVVYPPSRCDNDNVAMKENPDQKPVPNYMSVHWKQPKRLALVPENDERITTVAKVEQEKPHAGLSNTNQSNQGISALGYVEDGYSTISKYQDDSGDEGPDEQAREAISRLSGAILRERKTPSSEAGDSTMTRYSSCASGIEINTSRQKVVRDDKVRFGTLDRRKLEDVTPSKFVNGRYVNPWDTWAEPTVTSAIKWACMRKQGGIPSKEILNQTLPVLTPDLLRIRAPPPSGINVTWLGHASLLVQFDGVSILTDPIFSSFCGPASLVGVRRYRPAPCEIRLLPKVHAVVISHTHYDHLDLPTVVALNQWYGSSLRWFVPLGVMDWFASTGVENIMELDWWQENCIPSHSDVTFAFTPSQHWSQRTAFDRQKCLWGSWSVIGPNHSFFFAGDTGYCKAFKEIGQRYGPFDLAAIPIGAYLPRFFLSPQHVDPAQAVQIHMDVQAKQSVAIHWGTFALGKEHYLAPREDLKVAREDRGLSEEDFFTMKHGETRLVAAEEEEEEEERVPACS